MTIHALVPRLAVDDAAAAIDFYVRALGGTERIRVTGPTGAIVHAEIGFDAETITLTEADGEVTRSPSMLGGSPVLLKVVVDDADALAAVMVEHGAQVVIPVADRDYGYREGRLRDPVGHFWIVSQDL